MAAILRKLAEARAVSIPPIDLDQARLIAWSIPPNLLRATGDRLWRQAMTAKPADRPMLLYTAGYICLRIADERVWDSHPPIICPIKAP